MKQEAFEPMQIVISAHEPEDLKKAVRACQEHIDNVRKEYEEFIRQEGMDMIEMGLSYEG